MAADGSVCVHVCVCVRERESVREGLRCGIPSSCVFSICFFSQGAQYSRV